MVKTVVRRGRTIDFKTDHYVGLNLSSDHAGDDAFYTGFVALEELNRAE